MLLATNRDFDWVWPLGGLEAQKLHSACSFLEAQRNYLET